MLATHTSITWNGKIKVCGGAIDPERAPTKGWDKLQCDWTSGEPDAADRPGCLRATVCTLPRRLYLLVGKDIDGDPDEFSKKRENKRPPLGSRSDIRSCGGGVVSVSVPGVR